jgi:hypothetical protein
MFIPIPEILPIGFLKVLFDQTIFTVILKRTNNREFVNRHVEDRPKRNDEATLSVPSRQPQPLLRGRTHELSRRF